MDLCKCAFFIFHKQYVDADEGGAAAEIWDSLIREGYLPDPRQLEEEGEDGLLEALGDLEEVEDEEEDSGPLLPGFPELTGNQKNFAVNPSFRSYYDPSYKQLEGIGDVDLGEEDIY